MIELHLRMAPRLTTSYSHVRLDERSLWRRWLQHDDTQELTPDKRPAKVGIRLTSTQTERPMHEDRKTFLFCFFRDSTQTHRVLYLLATSGKRLLNERRKTQTTFEHVRVAEMERETETDSVALLHVYRQPCFLGINLLRYENERQKKTATTSALRRLIFSP